MSGSWAVRRSERAGTLSDSGIRGPCVTAGLLLAQSLLVRKKKGYGRNTRTFRGPKVKEGKKFREPIRTKPKRSSQLWDWDNLL